MTNLSSTPVAGIASMQGGINQAVANLNEQVRLAMEKHAAVLERSEETTSTLLSQLLKAQTENITLIDKLREAEQLVSTLRETEQARDLATTRCKKATEELKAYKEEVREYLVMYHRS